MDNKMHKYPIHSVSGLNAAPLALDFYICRQMYIFHKSEKHNAESNNYCHHNFTRLQFESIPLLNSTKEHTN